MTALERVGRSAIRGAEDAGILTLQLWRVLLTLPRIMPVPGKRRRWRAAVQQMLSIGVEALPMAGIMSFCIGYVLALQSAAELRRFSALQFVVNLVAVSFTRELGALITAIAVSGRTASAISAEVGTMAVTEEIDALHVMGLDPVEFTLAPKYLCAKEDSFGRNTSHSKPRASHRAPSPPTSAQSSARPSRRCCAGAAGTGRAPPSASASRARSSISGCRSMGSSNPRSNLEHGPRKLILDAGC